MNASYQLLLPIRPADELVALGIEEPTQLSGVWSLTHALVASAAPLPLMERVLKLGPDLGLTALVRDNDETLYDGTPLHLACAQQAAEFIDLLLRSGASVTARNNGGEIPLHTFFNACRGKLGLNDVSIVAAFLREGSPVENETADGLKLECESIVGIPLKRFIELVDEYGSRLADGNLRQGPPLLIRRFLIEENGKLIEVDEMRLRSIVLNRLEGDSSKRSVALRLEHMPLEDVLRIDVVRSALETLHRSRAPLIELPPSPLANAPQESDAFLKPDSESNDDLLDAERYEDEDDADSEWLKFPDLDLSGSSESLMRAASSDEIFGPDDSVLDEPDESAEDDDIEEVAADALEASGVSDGIELAEAGSQSDSPEFVETDDPDLTKTAAVKAATSVFTSLFSGGAYSTGLNRQSYLDAAIQFHNEGSPHEAYLMLDAIKEATATAPTLLNATTRALRTFLFRAPPGVTQHLGVLLDRSGYYRPSGYHPYMAEYLCLLNHPFDERKDVGTLGGLSLGISSVARLYRYGSMRGDLLHEYGRIGALNFSFHFWRFDTQPIRLSSDATTLFEQAGMQRHYHSATEQWENPVTKKTEHLWGPIFTAGPGDDFHRYFKHDEARRLGYAPLSLSTSVVFRRAGVFIGTQDGVLLWRNSSLLFGRDRFEHPGLVCSEPLSVKEIVNLTPDDIAQRFHSITGSDYFAEHQQSAGFGRKEQSRFTRGGEAVALAAQQLKHFNDQFQTVRVMYGRMKFDTHLETAWSSDGKRLRGGYRSPLFPFVVSQLEDRFNNRASGGKPAIEYLAVSNPDYPPYAPHAMVQIDERSLECLRLLADGKDAKVSSRAAKETGLEQFLSVAFTRGRNSELILMPGRE